jgi:HTH-type transcriptional regulator/antitoxin HigA
MPATYEELLLETQPQIIENREQYDATLRRIDDLMLRGRARTKDETKLLRLLSLLVQDYDRRHAMPPDEFTPAERLQYLLETSGKTPADLLPIFGQRSHVNEALTGKRPISAGQARRLGEIFHLAPGYFL